MDTIQNDGQVQDQAPVEAEVGDGEVGAVDQTTNEYDDLNAKYDLLLDNFNELRTAIVQQNNVRSTATEVVEEEWDDDEPLTGSKVNKIVQKAITSAVSQNAATSDRKTWDDKAKTDFPVSDPKFQMELKKVWNELRDSGLDPNHPRALYMAAKATAKNIGFKKSTKSTSKSDEFTSEAPTASRSGASRSSSSKVAMVSEDDPRVSFYRMRGEKDPKKIEALRIKLAERDARKGRR